MGGRLLWGALIVASTTRLAFLLFAVGDEDRLTEGADIPNYLALARDLRSGYLDSGSSIFFLGLRRTPLFPLFLAGPLEMTSSVLVAMVPNVLVSTATVWLTYRLGTQLFGYRAGLLAGVILAFDPVSIIWSGYPQPEALFTFFLVAGVLLTVQAAEWDNGRRMVAAGLVLGASALTRPVSLYLPVVLAGLLLYLVTGSWGRRVALATLLLVGAAVPTGAWTARNYAVTGVPTFSTIDGTNFLYYRAAGAIAESEATPLQAVRARLREEVADRVTPDMNAAEVSRVERSLGIRYSREHPAGYLKMAGRGAARLLFGPGKAPLVRRVTGSDEAGIAGAVLLGGSWLALLSIYVLVGTGVVTAIRRRSRRWLWVAGVTLYMVVVSSGVETYSRFRYPLMPFFAVLAGLGMAHLAARLRSFGPRTPQPSGARPPPTRCPAYNDMPARAG